MKRALAITAALVAIIFLIAWMDRPRSVVPIDVLIDHQPWCAQSVTHIGLGVILTGVERGVCTSRNVIRN